jgi:hypothetical protein
VPTAHAPRTEGPALAGTDGKVRPHRGHADSAFSRRRSTQLRETFPRDARSRAPAAFAVRQERRHPVGSQAGSCSAGQSPLQVPSSDGLVSTPPPRQEYAVSAGALWGALKAGLPSVTSQATFYEEAHRVEWTMDLSAFDWPERMSARVEASRDGGAVVTVEGKSAYGTGAKSIVGPGRRRKAAAVLLAAVSAVVSQSGGAAARPPADDDGYRYWNGREWTLEPPPPAPPGPPGWPPQHSPPR